MKLDRRSACPSISLPSFGQLVSRPVRRIEVPTGDQSKELLDMRPSARTAKVDVTTDVEACFAWLINLEFPGVNNSRIYV